MSLAVDCSDVTGLQLKNIGHFFLRLFDLIFLCCGKSVKMVIVYSIFEESYSLRTFCVRAEVLSQIFSNVLIKKSKMPVTLLR